jgi:hypothetical protein
MYFIRDIANIFIKEEREKINKIIKESVKKKNLKETFIYNKNEGNRNYNSNVDGSIRKIIINIIVKKSINLNFLYNKFIIL